MNINQKIKVAILGCSGKTGSQVLRYALHDEKIQLIGGLVSPNSKFLGNDLGDIVSYHHKLGIAAKADLFEVIYDADMIIDFSTINMTGDLINKMLTDNHYCQKKLIIGVTGLDYELRKKLINLGEKTVIFQSSNMSFGIAMLAEFFKKYSAIINDEYETIIHDIHHSAKKDAPSGTALMLRNALNNDEINIHSSRISDVKGIHEVMMINNCETIDIRHEITDRSIFAINSLKIAHWLDGIKENNLYGMSNFVKYFEGLKK